MSFNGNQISGGRNKFARRLSKNIKRGGSLLGLLGLYQDYKELSSSTNTDQTVEESIDLLIDIVGFAPYMSVIPVVWSFGGKTFFYNAVVPQTIMQNEIGILGLPSTQPFK